jgi:3-hydroxyisobutyrate dehydrogenase-like beta-hydroxyacid dehydrogenase
MSTVGFIGLGAMGSAMATRVLESGHDLLVHNRTASKARAHLDEGAGWRDTPAAVAADADAVFSCLRDTAAVESVYLGTGGLVETARPGQVFVEHGTFAAQSAREIGRRLGEKGSEFLDIPITGGPVGAAHGTLTAMAGGSENALRGVADILGTYCGSVIHIGGLGAGVELKLVNQLLVSSHMAAAGEAIALLEALGISPEVARTVLTNGWASSIMFTRALDQIAADSLDGTGVTISGMSEVQDLIADLLTQSGTRAPVFATARSTFTRAAQSGAGESDPAALSRITTKEQAGAER